MTEKRFKLVDIGFVYDNDKLIGMKEIVDLLNAFHEENEQLKSDLAYFKTKNGSLETGMFNLERENEQLKQLIKIHKEDELETLNDLQRCEENNQRALSNIEKLTKGNEQLKSEIKDLNDILARYEERKLKE